MKKNKITPIPEEMFEVTMREQVLPFLEKHKVTGNFQREDATLYYEAYVNPREKASIVIAHGLCEFCSKFAEVIYYFYKAGFSVFIMDHRGHGYSTRFVEDLEKVVAFSYDEYVKDFHEFVIRIVQEKSKTGKLVLYGHSMGGAISALVLEHYPKLFECAILSSPMLEMNLGKVSNKVAWLTIADINIFGKTTSFAPGEKGFVPEPCFEKSSALSEARYMRIFKERLEDERKRTCGATYAWVECSLKAIKILQKNAYRVKLPVLLFQAGEDTLVKPEGQYEFAKNSANTTLIRMPNAKHEIYNATEETLKRYYAMIYQFIEQEILC